MTETPLKVCFVLSESDPLIKIGGLGDVGGTLPAALTALPPELTDNRKIDVRVVIPYHDILKQHQIPVKWLCNFKIPYDNGLFQDVMVLFGRMTWDAPFRVRVPCRLLKNKLITNQRNCL